MCIYACKTTLLRRTTRCSSNGKECCGSAEHWTIEGMAKPTLMMPLVTMYTSSLELGSSLPRENMAKRPCLMKKATMAGGWWRMNGRLLTTCAERTSSFASAKQRVNTILPSNPMDQNPSNPMNQNSSFQTNSVSIRTVLKGGM